MSSNGAESCAFCGKSRESARKLIAGPKASICDECVFLTYHVIIAEEGDAWTRELAQTFQDQLAALKK